MNRLILFSCLCLASVSATAQNDKVGIGTTMPQAQLHTTGSVQHDTLAGAGTRLVYANAQGRLTAAGPLNTNNINNNPTVQIPDSGCNSGNGVRSSITVAGQAGFIISANIKVRVNITHTYDADLRVFLLSPNRDTLCLIKNSGGNDSNFTNTIFWDGASSVLPSVGAPFSGTYKPTGGLATICTIHPDVSTFGAMGGGTINPNGTWTLLLFDAAAFDIGRLNDWGITFDGSDPVVPSYLTSNVIPKSNGIMLVNSSLYDIAGNVGIGTSSPTQKLDVAGTVKATDFVTGSGSSLSNAVNTNAAQTISGTKTFTAPTTINAGGSDAFTILNGGDTRLYDDAGTSSVLLYTSAATGTAGANKGVFTVLSDGKTYTFTGTGGAVSSDERLKQDIQPIKGSLAKLQQLHGYSYRYKSKSDAPTKEVGVLAQEVKKVLPEAVYTGADSMYSVSYNALVPLLINAVKEQQVLIEKTNKENKQLQLRLAAIESAIKMTGKKKAATAK